MLLPKSKKLTSNQIFEQSVAWKKAGKKIVLVTGVFDIFHSEHEAFLKAAARQGDILIVGIESDARVRLLKGPGRPVNTQDDRQEILTHLSYVTAVFVLPEDFSTPEQHRALIAQIRPDVLAVSEHSPHRDKKQAILQEYGGELRVVRPHNPAISTTQILKNMA